MSKISNQTTIKRPLEVTLLSMLHLIAGAIFAAMLILTIVYSITSKDELNLFITALGMKGYTPLFLGIVLAITTGIAFVSGIGMLKGSKWGWHVGAFYYAYNIFRNINFMFFIHLPISIFPLEALTSFINDPNLYFVKYLVRGFVFFLFYFIMNTKRFRVYFGLKLEKNLIVLLIEFLVLIIITSFFSGYTV